MSYKEKRAYEILGKEIEDLENEKQLLHEKLSNTNTNFEEISAASNRLGMVMQALEEKGWQWLELSEKMG